MDKTLESQFDKIENLTWYPWIGQNYVISNRRILIVGDSHYCVDENGEFDEVCYDKFMKEKSTTRDYAIDYAEAKKEWNFNHNLRLCMLNTDDKTLLESFWSKISFYEFIQEPMKKRNARPTEIQYITAWHCFVDLVKIIKPTDCIFIGVRSETCFGYCMTQLGLHYDIKDMPQKINGTHPRKASITLSDSYKLKLLFIKHTSMGFSPNYWHELLKDEMPEAMEFLTTL